MTPARAQGLLATEHLLPTLASDCQEEVWEETLDCMLLLTQGPREHSESQEVSMEHP